MNRHKGLERRATLKRTGFLRRTGRLPTRKGHKPANFSERAQIRYAVFERDGWKCRSPIPGCWGPLTPHHVLKASQGGEFSEDNLVTLCAHHNDLIETDAEFARDMHRCGLVVYGWEAAQKAAVDEFVAVTTYKGPWRATTSSPFTVGLPKRRRRGSV